jgi:hypothetical protein
MKSKKHFFSYIKNKYCCLNSKSCLLLFSVSIFILFFDSAFAQGDLVVFPKRMVFEGRSKTQQINLTNIGKDSAAYNVSFVEFRMTELGSFEDVKEPDLGQKFASPYLRVYPRLVTLAPNESQTVKVQLINASNLDDGEYRSHLYFRGIKNSKPLGQQKAETNSGSLSVKIEAVFGVSIASIIRKGDSDTVVTISGLKFEKEADSVPFLSFDINRVGNMSTYGDIDVIYISIKGKSYTVGKIKGLGVYTPGTIRKNKMLLQKPEGLDFIGGKFKVIYTINESSDIIAEKELDL